MEMVVWAATSFIFIGNQYKHALAVRRLLGRYLFCTHYIDNLGFSFFCSGIEQKKN